MVYAVVYSLILVFGLLGNLLALWMFRAYVKETKKAVMFMMNLAVADLLQVTVSAAFLLQAEKVQHYSIYTSIKKDSKSM